VKFGKIVAVRVVQEADDITIISANGVVIRNRVKDISKAGRAARGVRLIGLGSGDRAVSLARIADAELKKVEAAPAAPVDGRNGNGAE
jgi:DNA gyrase subunit A